MTDRSRKSVTGNRQWSRVERLFAALREKPDAEALVHAGRSYSFGELDRLSADHSAGLAALGLRTGDRVAVFAEASVEVIVALLGHYRSGIVHVPINTRYRAEEAGHILRDSGARAVLFPPGSEQETVLDEVTDTPSLEHRIPIDFRFPISDFRAGGSPLPADTATAVLVYTSGTTGKSKGAALSFGALVDNTLALTSGWRFSSSDRLALALPLFHVHGLAIGVHGALLHGMTMLLSSRFEAAEVVREFRESGATVFMGVPTMYVRLLEHLSTHPDAAEAFSRGRLFTSGSAPLPAADFEAFERVTGRRILERYGMTETLFTLTNPYDGERRAGTVGRPVDGCEVRIVADSESGREAAEGEPGEVLVRSNGQMTEYWGRPAETRDSYRDGWFVTGDAAVRDAEGYVRILGRQSVDVIKSGGFKISAREIEDVIARHENVREVAVLGVPDRVWGERIVAAVVLRSHPEAAAAGVEAEISDLCRRCLADYKRPREVRIVEELPRNALGKVQKHRIREELER
jgi:malonyl-CoA/methylmalonyl-CoA synthetase